jgi:hypothetical protein
MYYLCNARSKRSRPLTQRQRARAITGSILIAARQVFEFQGERQQRFNMSFLNRNGAVKTFWSFFWRS